MAPARAPIRALMATAVVVGVAAAAAGCWSEEDRSPPLDEPGWVGVGRSSAPPRGGQQPDGGTDGGVGSGDGGEGDGGGADRCAALGGRCMSDPAEPTVPAFCEALALVEIQGACTDVEKSCCAPSSAGQCEAAGGQCLTNPAGTGLPTDCTDRGLVAVDAICPGIDQSCCG